MKFEFFVGVDVSKDTLDYAVFSEGKFLGSKQVENNASGLKAMWKHLKSTCSNDPSLFVFCLEHTGVYCNPIVNSLVAEKLAVWLENPLAIKAFFGMERGKSDSTDARRIAEYAWAKRDKVRVWEPPRSVVTRLKNLLTLRERLVKTRKSLTVAITSTDGFLDPDMAKTNKAITAPIVDKLDTQIRVVEKKIRDLINKDPDLKKYSEIVESVNGIGPIVSANIIVATNEFKAINDPRKFACHSGLAPFRYQSGTSIQGRSKVSHKANKKLKTLFHLAARAAISREGELRAYYLRRIEEGKNKMSVLNAVGNKIIHRVFACVRQERLYEKNYVPQLA